MNCAVGVSIPKSVKRTEYRVRQIDTQKTMTLPQVLTLIEASKDTPIYMQILFAVLMGLRRGEINGLKYSDVDYINRRCSTRKKCAPTLQKRGHEWFLDFPFEENVTLKNTLKESELQP